MVVVSVLFQHGFGLPLPFFIRVAPMVVVENMACLKLAEKVGFEPTEPCGSIVFKAIAISRSATSPII